MNNFYYYNPTKIIFGKCMIQNIVREIPITKNILIIYGMGSVKENGIFEELNKVLNNYNVFEFGGISPNPSCEKCIEVVEFIRKNNIDYLIALGGGSVIDATKFISLAVYYDGNPWDFIKDKSKTPVKSLDFGVVLTLPATGSEMNNSFVISNNITKEKLTGSAFSTYPKFSIMDPLYMKTLSKKQLLNGLIDTYVHILEQYLTYEHNGVIQDHHSETFLCALVEIAQDVINNASYDKNAAFMWMAAQVSSGILCRGVPTDWATHEIGHQLTALTNLDHAQTLAIILFGVWNHQFELKKKKLIKYGKNVLKLTGTEDEIAKKAIVETELFFNRLGINTKLSNYDLDVIDIAEKISDYFKSDSPKLGENKNIDFTAVKQIIQSRK